MNTRQTLLRLLLSVIACGAITHGVIASPPVSFPTDRDDSAFVLGSAADWYVAEDGTPQGRGTRNSPWDIESALGGAHDIGPGDTLWILAGTYKHADRKLGSPGFVVKLAGKQGRPIRVCGEPNRRVTIDGGLTVTQPSTWLWIRDLEILVSENFTMSRRVEETGSHPKSYNRPRGGLNIQAGDGCKYINLVIHDNAQGVSFWNGATDSELHGCLIYDNGWDAPDRGHGHAIYTQNQDGVKTISDCIMTGGYGYTMHAYGSSRAYVDNYLIVGNIAYDGGPFLIGGGRPSRNIRAIDNVLHGPHMQLGYSAPANENCEVRGNLIVDGGLSINRYQKVINVDNLVLKKNAPRPTTEDVRVVLRPNRYDPNRAHLAVLNWKRNATVDVKPGKFLAAGDRYRLMDPRGLFSKPVATGTYDGKSIRVAMDGEFSAFVLIRQPRS